MRLRDVWRGLWCSLVWVFCRFVLVISCELLLGVFGVRFVVLVVCFGRECCCFGWFGLGFGGWWPVACWCWCVLTGGGFD